jgi:hypothetical protein
MEENMTEPKLTPMDDVIGLTLNNAQIFLTIRQARELRDNLTRELKGHPDSEPPEEDG